MALVDPEGKLRPLACSSGRVHLVKLFEIQSQDGPCLECWRRGEAVQENRLATAQARWPLFVPAALGAGFRSAYALPMRLRDEHLAQTVH